MKKLLPICFLLIACISVTAEPQLLDDRFERAYQAWDMGDYILALRGLDALLKAPDGDRWLDRIALLTGELYPDFELTKDGRAPRFSPDGRYAAYETGTRPAVVTHIANLERQPFQVVDVNGENLVFSPSRDAVACFRVKDTPEILGLRKEIETLSKAETPDRQTITAKQRQLAALEGRSMELWLRDRSTGKEQRLDDDGMLKAGLAFSADGKDLYFAGAKESETTSNQIYAVSETGKPRPLTSGAGFKTNPIAVPGGKYLIYTIAAQSPFPRAAAADETGRGGQGAAQAGGAAGRGGARGQGAAPAGAAGARGGGGGGGPQGRRVDFAVMNLSNGIATNLSGSAAPSVADSGSAIIYMGSTGTENSIQFLKLAEPLSAAAIKKTQERIGSIAISPDGTGVTFETPFMRNKDTEIYYIKSDGTGEVRLSREIQPDWGPRFLAGNKVLAIKGERRHARSYVYEVEAHTNFKLFHNNTVRTLAQEYEWATSPAGNRVLIVADRDGDTISPERGVYLVDLNRKIAKEALLARIQSDLASEQALRSAGEAMYRPVMDKIKAVIEQVSITKLYEYEESLFGFDVKALGQPGNKLAGDYIYNTFASFGYKPEYQWFDARGNTRTANILATLPGTENPELVYVLGSHYDSVGAGPGADDNETGIAVLLEAARTLAKTPLPATVIFAAFTGEEAGDLGSHEFVRQAKEKKMLVMAALNNDMIGFANDHHLDNTIRWTNEGLRDLQHAAGFLFSKMITYDTRYYRSTDAAAFYDGYGDIVSGLGSYPVLGNPYYHQSTDLLETVNHQLVTEAAKMTTASIMMLASCPSRVKDLKAEISGDGIDLSWTANPEKSVTGYTVAYGPESNPMAKTLIVKTTKARIPGVKKGEKLAISVKAVNARGLSSWDWARIAK
jgi:hypothetical protein